MMRLLPGALDCAFFEAVTRPKFRCPHPPHPGAKTPQASGNPLLSSKSAVATFVHAGKCSGNRHRAGVRLSLLCPRLLSFARMRLPLPTREPFSTPYDHRNQLGAASAFLWRCLFLCKQSPRTTPKNKAARRNFFAQRRACSTRALGGPRQPLDRQLRYYSEAFRLASVL